MILVTPLSQIESTIRDYRPSHMVTLLSPSHMIETPRGIDPDRHLRLALDDVAEDWAAETPPTRQHVERLLEFGRGWQASQPMLIHCWAGISRSMASAYILLCERSEHETEEAIARRLRAAAPHAYPNPLLISHADNLLNRQGRMVKAIESIGRGEIVAEGYCVELPLQAP